MRVIKVWRLPAPKISDQYLSQTRMLQCMSFDEQSYFSRQVANSLKTGSEALDLDAE